METITKETRNLKVELSESDLDDLRKEMTFQLLEKQKVELKKKQIVKEFNDQIKKLDTVINRLAHLSADGFEMQDISCSVEFNTPVYGKKKLTRMDTLEEWIEEMSKEEFNLFTQVN